MLNEDQEFFIRELTRKLDEQINSIRRELDNLKKVGLLRSRVKNRKKYYFVNTDFIFFNEIKSIFLKSATNQNSISKDIMKFGEVKLLVLSGIFLDKETKTVDMLIVGDVDKEKLADYLNNDIKTDRPVRFAIISEEDYKYRISLKDRFINEIINDSENEMPIQKI